MSVDNLTRGRLAKHYEGLIRRDGVVMTKTELYTQLMAEGYTPQLIDNVQKSNGTTGIVYCLRNSAGDYYDIPKLVYLDLKED